MPLGECGDFAAGERADMIERQRILENRIEILVRDHSYVPSLW